MNITVTDPRTEAVATADETRPTRLATAVQLAVLCRDNNLDWPRKIFFSDDYPDQLHLYTSTVTQMLALASAMGAKVRPTSRTTGTDGEYLHHHASGVWLGFHVSVTCLETLPAATAPVDAATSAAIDDLVATVNAEPTAETEAQIGAALAVPIELVQELADDPHRRNPEPHYRLYRDRDGLPVVICVQDFDYPDYDAARFLSPEAWSTEVQANAALDRYARENHKPSIVCQICDDNPHLPTYRVTVGIHKGLYVCEPCERLLSLTTAKYDEAVSQ